MRAQRFALAAVLLSLAVASCATRSPLGAHPTEPPTSEPKAPDGTSKPIIVRLPGTVPWSDAAAPRESSPTPSDGRRCSSRDLEVSVSGQGATGSFAGSIYFRNKSRSACGISGWPSITFWAADGRRLPVANHEALPTWDSSQQTPPTGWPVVTLRPGKGAQSLVQWFDWCLSSVPDRWRIELDGTLSFVENPHPTARCDGTPGSEASSITVGSVEIPSEEPTQPSPLFAFIDVSQTVKAGGVLRFTVELTNYGDGSVSLASCPAYRERLVSGLVVATARYRINCGARPAVPARTSVVFAMEFQIPKNLRGPYDLQWIVQGTPSSNGAFASLEIAG